MAISLTQIIAAIEAKSNTTDSSSSISDVLRLSIGAEAVSDGTILYDSAGVMPTDSAFIGTMAAASDGAIYFYNGTAWNAVDSAETVSPNSFQGSSFGYSTSGEATGLTIRDEITKFSFSTDGNATDVGNLVDTLRRDATGHSSSVSGYSTGGHGGPAIKAASFEKFPFATDTNASDVANLTVARGESSSQNSQESGYTSAGRTEPADAYSTVIDKFPFATDANATDVGDILNGVNHSAGNSSGSHGYVSGGTGPHITPAHSDVIEKFPFSADANSTDVGDLTNPKNQSAAANTADYGYIAGGGKYAPTHSLASYSNVIEKFSYSTDGNATDVGDLTQSRQGLDGSSSTVNGYVAGGRKFPFAPTDIIEKFPFATDANATDVGNLIAGKYWAHDQQV